MQGHLMHWHPFSPYTLFHLVRMSLASQHHAPWNEPGMKTNGGLACPFKKNKQFSILSTCEWEHVERSKTQTLKKGFSGRVQNANPIGKQRLLRERGQSQEQKGLYNTTSSVGGIWGTRLMGLWRAKPTLGLALENAAAKQPFSQKS